MLPDAAARSSDSTWPLAGPGLEVETADAFGSNAAATADAVTTVTPIKAPELRLLNLELVPPQKAVLVGPG
jgi:hypothetical protein